MLKPLLAIGALLSATVAVASPYAGSCFPEREIPLAGLNLPQAVTGIVNVGSDISSYPYGVTVYRQGCFGSGSAVLVRFHSLGTPAGRFPQLSILQNGVVHNNIPYARSPYASGEGVYPDFEPIGPYSTVVLDAESVDYEAAFELVVDGEPPTSFDVPAFDPSQSAEATGPLPITSYVSGTYFDTSTPGEGIQITLDENNTIIVAWYTFDEDGKPLWLAGAGAICTGAFCHIPPRDARVKLVAQRGGGFAGNFDPANIVGTDWGYLYLEWPSCGRMRLRLDQTHSDPELPSGSGEREWVKLSGVAGAACD